MSEIINACVTGLNDAGREFCEYAFGMFLQSGVLVAVLFIVDFLLRKRVRATLRYWIWMLVFVKLLLPPDLSIPTGIGYWCSRYVPPAPTTSPRVAETGGTPVMAEADAFPVMPSAQPFHPAPTVIKPAASAAVASESLTWQGGVLLLWGAGVLAFAGLVIQRLLFVRVLIAQGEPAPDDLVDTLEQCRRRTGVRREVDLKVSPNTFSPAVCGLFKLTILIPAGLLDRLSPKDLKTVLIHELSHIKRGDLWINSLQTALQIVYFYNPLIWLANAIVRRVREQAVDEMVLVALGAEAKSYSNTLIDIAEMAFLRVSPALRLIGVAESRKSLEGRIRHMMTRPIPKSARVGMVGVFVVTAIGAILLPMARAAVEPQQRFIANLPGGVTVELVGVCNWSASGPVSWRADGSTLDKLLYARKWNVHPGANDYGFLFRVAGTDDIDLMWNRIDGSEGSEGSCDVVDDQGNRLEGGNAAVASIKPSTVQTTLRVGLPTGPWNTISSHDGKQMSTGRGSGVLWSQAFEDSSGTRIVASTESQRMRKHRIAAIDTEGAVHIAPGAGSVSSGSVHQFTAHFPDLKPAQIKEFQYQIRECQMMEFRGISLRPGHETAVSVEVDGTRDEHNLPPAGNSMSRDDAARAESAARLLALGKAALVFTVDHDDRLPEKIEDLPDDAGLAKSWLLENVVYLGKGMRTFNEPDSPVAYDKTLLRGGRGTNVLYLDSHVEFVTPETLKQIGITIVGSATSSPGEVIQSYEVNRSVADFPPGEDFSTPEAAYATINRMDRDDSSAWQKVSVARLAARMGVSGSESKKNVDPEWAKVLANARIKEVLVWNMTKAMVIAELPQDLSSKKIVDPFDVRFLGLENGRWLNMGNDRVSSVEAAETHFKAWMERDAAQAAAMPDPLAHADEIQAAASQLFDKLRAADYAEILSHYRNGKWDADAWKKFPTMGLYTVHTDYPSFALWCARHFKDNPIIRVELGEVFIGDALIADKTGRPTVPYKLTLQDGTVLAGNLPFEYEVYRGQGHWNALEGIDWHLWPNGTK